MVNVLIWWIEFMLILLNFDRRLLAGTWKRGKKIKKPGIVLPFKWVFLKGEKVEKRKPSWMWQKDLDTVVLSLPSAPSPTYCWASTQRRKEALRLVNVQYVPGHLTASSSKEILNFTDGAKSPPALQARCCDQPVHLQCPAGPEGQGEHHLRSHPWHCLCLQPPVWCLAPGGTEEPRTPAFLQPESVCGELQRPQERLRVREQSGACGGQLPGDPGSCSAKSSTYFMWSPPWTFRAEQYWKVSQNLPPLLFHHKNDWFSHKSEH